MSTNKAELAAAHGAYSSLQRLERHEAERVLEWVRKRLDSDERGRETTQYPEIEPTDWIVAGQVEGPSYPSRDECATEELDFTVSQVTEVIGRAPVRQFFAVLEWIDDGREVRWFDDRAKAEAYLAAMLAEPPPCETCKDTGWVDNRAGGIATSGWSECPDCGNPTKMERPV